jgi:uncharacterized repeat protein (TIGR03847 family)
MASTREFGPLAHIMAEAIGQPGQRRFRLLAMSEGGETASLWLEKEQLNALGDAIQNVLEDQGYVYQRMPLDDLGPDPVYPLNAAVDFRLAQLSLGLDSDGQNLVIIAADGPQEDEGATAVTMSVGYRTASELRRQIAEVVAAGRPPCPLCSGPMDPAGHVCVKTNGHNPH